MGATLRGRDATRPVPFGSYQLIRIGDISQDGTFLNEDFARIEPRQTVCEEQLLRPGDVLFPNRGTRTTALALGTRRWRRHGGPGLPRVCGGSRVIIHGVFAGSRYMPACLRM